MALPTITNNSPSAGHIAWNDFVVKYDGQSYNVDAGSTSARWVWWRYNAGTPSVEGGETIPTDLTDDDLVLFKNQDGLGVRIQATSLVDGELLVDGTVLAEAVAANQINSTHIVTAGLDAGVIKFGEMSGERLSVGTITAELFASALALIEKRIIVGALGNITIDDSDGFRIVTDVGSIHFPANGGRPSVLGDFTALSATINDALRILGEDNFIGGTLLAASGVSSPSQAASLSNYWPSTKVAPGDPMENVYSMIEGGNGGEVWGLCPTATGFEIRSLAYGATTSTLVRTLDDVGEGMFSAVEPVYTSGGMCSIYNYDTSLWEHFILCSDWRYVNYPETETYYVFKFTQNFSVKLGEFMVTMPGFEDYETAVIGTVRDTTDSFYRVGVAWPVGATQKVSFRRYTTDGVASEPIVTSTWTMTTNLRFLHQDDHMMIGVENNLRAHHPTTLARVATSDFAKPPVIGSTGRFVALQRVASLITLGLSYGFFDTDETLWYMSADYTKKTLWLKYAFYDGDPGGVYGAGGETKPSPSKSFTREIGAWMRADVTKAPDGGDPDDPDRIRYYLSETDSGYQLQGAGAVGEHASYFRGVVTGAAPSAINSWDSRPGNSGRLRSLIGSLYEGTDHGIWDLNGTGKGRVGPFSWNDLGKDTSKTVRELGAYERATSGAVIANGVESNIATVAVTLRAGHRYRAIFNGSFLNGTAAQGILVHLKYGVGVTVAGTVFLDHMVDFRTTGRAIGTSCVGYFDWSGADTVVNVVAVMEGSGGTAQSYAVTNRKTYFMVEEISI